MKIDTIRQLQEQIDVYRRSQHSDSDKMRRELADMHSKIIAKDDAIQELHEKCEELIQSQIVQIPIFANNLKGFNKKKKGNAINKGARSKSQNRGNKL